MKAISHSASSRRAVSHEEIAPLLEHCKCGRLFAVQKWISEGKPVNAIFEKGNRRKSPLTVAIERGFHSLVQVLLAGGALQEPTDHNSPMVQALRTRRSDIVELLVEYGFDPKSIDLEEVFASWDPTLMRYFIERGADIRAGNPFARALCNKIRTCLPVYKECRARFPDLQPQANIALRYHCKHGNIKWVSLMLWAGADPFERGPEDPAEDMSDDEGMISALSYAALYGHYDIFELKAIRSRGVPSHALEILKYSSSTQGNELLKNWLSLGLNPNDQPNGGSSILQHHLEHLDHYRPYLFAPRKEKDLDSSECRESLRSIHLLAKAGAKWIPSKSEINAARRTLIKMKVDYTIDFAWIMARYKSCNVIDLEALIKTSTVKRLLGQHYIDVVRMMQDMEEPLS